MSEAVSALQGAKTQGFATVEETGLQGMITLRGDLTSGAMIKALKSATGLGVPARGTALSDAGFSLCWMSPDELLLLCPYGDVAAVLQTVQTALDGEHALAVDVSDARAMFRVSGDGVREVIAKLAPVDMRADAFPPGSFRRTRFAQVAAAFWMQSETEVRVICFRSVGQYMFDLLSNAASEGSEVGYF